MKDSIEHWFPEKTDKQEPPIDRVRERGREFFVGGPPEIFTRTGSTFSAPWHGMTCQGLVRPPTVCPETSHGTSIEATPMDKINCCLIQLEQNDFI